VNVTDLIKQHEGYSGTAYICPAGYWTVGYGRNLQSTGISEKEAEMLLQNDIDRARALLSTESYWAGLDGVRKAVLIDMVVNLGFQGFCQFKKFRGALEQQNYADACAEMIQSKWYAQVGNRSIRLTQMMRTGEWPQK